MNTEKRTAERHDFDKFGQENNENQYNLKEMIKNVSLEEKRKGNPITIGVQVG